MKGSSLASLVVLAALVIPATVAGLAGSVSSAENPKWTVMIYMANDYPVPLDWQDDVNEMEAAVQAPGTTIVALVDDSGPDNSVLLRIEHDPNFLDPTIVSTAIDHGGEVFPGNEANMASAETLEAFINFTARAYPADRYVLVLWGHGAGWQGLCPDGSDLLNLSELATALADVVPTLGHGIDMVVIDSCAQATAETMLQVVSAKVIVASEKDVPFAGLPYVLVLDQLAADPFQTIEKFGEAIADTYVTWSRTNSEYSTTMAVFSNTGYLYHQLRNLSIMGISLDLAYHANLTRALGATEGYEIPYSIDLGDFMRRLISEDVPLGLKYEAYRTLRALDKAIIHFAKYDNPYASDGIRVTNATGLAIYVPDRAPFEAEYSNLRIAQTGWDLFGTELRNATLAIALGPAPQVEVLDGGDGRQVARITWEGYDLIRVWAFQSTPEGLILMNIFENTTHNVVVEGVVGRLVLSACGYLSGVVRGHAETDLRLEGEVTIDVAVTRNGRQVTDSVEVILSSGNASVIGELTDGSLYRLDVDVPSSMDVGELVRIEVRDEGTGELLGKAWTYVPSRSDSVTVELVKDPEGRGPMIVALVFALVPGLLILVFAVLLYRQHRLERGF